MFSNSCFSALKILHDLTQAPFPLTLALLCFSLTALVYTLVHNPALCNPAFLPLLMPSPHGQKWVNSAGVDRSKKRMSSGLALGQLLGANRWVPEILFLIRVFLYADSLGPLYICGKDQLVCPKAWTILCLWETPICMPKALAYEFNQIYPDSGWRPILALAGS